MRRTPAFRIDLEPSRRAVVFVAVAYGLAALTVATLPIDAPLRLAIVALIVLLAARVWERELAPHASEGVAGLVLRMNATLVVLRRDGRVVEGRLLPGGWIHPWAITVVWRADGERRRRAFLIAPDAASPDALRRLRVRLLYAISDEEASVPESHARASISRALSALAWPARR